MFQVWLIFVFQVYPDTPIVDCLQLLLNKGISGVPVVTRDECKVIDIYSRFDVIGIAAEDRFDDLDMTVEEALRMRNSLKVFQAFRLPLYLIQL